MLFSCGGKYKQAGQVGDKTASSGESNANLLKNISIYTTSKLFKVHK